jgi:UDP-glucuronate decarboxylase
MNRHGSRQVLVAGGAGFLGSHLCERLIADGLEVTCLDNFLTGHHGNLVRLEREPRFRLIECDIVEPLPESLARRRFERVFNLACAASPPLYQADPEHTMLTSVIGTKHLLHLAEACGARLLMASTSEVYGDPHTHPQTESYWGNVNCTGPRACYDEGKRAAESLCFDFDRLGRASVRVARIFNTYGPRLSANDGRVVSNVLCQAVAGRDITIFGDGSQTRSFCYVDDLTEGLVRLSLHQGPQPGPINLGNPAELTITGLVDLVLKLTRSRSRVIHLPLPTDDPRRRRPDIAKAASLLDWSPVTPLEDGLRATMDWIREVGPPVRPARLGGQAQGATSAFMKPSGLSLVASSAASRRSSG